jgi:hypothetical protein
MLIFIRFKIKQTKQRFIKIKDKKKNIVQTLRCLFIKITELENGEKYIKRWPLVYGLKLELQWYCLYKKQKKERYKEKKLDIGAFLKILTRSRRKSMFIFVFQKCF